MSVPPADTVPILTLPPDEAAAVAAAYAAGRVILEYGSGGSTVLAAEMAGKTVTTVESDRAWAQRMRDWFAAHPPASPVTVHHADIGTTRDWGYPKYLRSHMKWAGYPIGIWDEPGFVAPDVVLVDGRFRIACFLTVMLKTPHPVTVLWDDYDDRPHYHRVETLVQPVAKAGRLARFELTPTALSPAALRLLADSYLDPR
ncbi:MAG: hypothetical protein LCH61_04205 [Proteobacteria bacterium]|nr:hypothetical protein [Pseudomonadota bacterium]